MKSIAPDVQLGIGVKIYDFVNLYAAKSVIIQKLELLLRYKKGPSLVIIAKYQVIRLFAKE